MEQEIMETGVEEQVPPTETTESDDQNVAVVENVDAGQGESGEKQENKIVKGLESALAAERRKRREAEQLLNEQQQKPVDEPVAQPEVAHKPRLSDFDDHEQYYEALTDWKMSERDRAEADRRAKSNMEVAQRRISESVTSLHSNGRQKYDDWDATVNVENLPITEVMRDSMLNIENGSTVFYHLGKNPSLAAEIAQMPILKQSMEIARLEAKLTAKPKKDTTKAPDPIEPVGSASSAKKLSANELASRDPREFIRQRNEGLI